jgi:hypothetical protein
VRAVYVPDALTTRVLPVAPVLQVVLLALLVRVTEFPAQIDTVPLGVILGVAGVGFMTTLTAVLAGD